MRFEFYSEKVLRFDSFRLTGEPLWLNSAINININIKCSLRGLIPKSKELNACNES